MIDRRKQLPAPNPAFRETLLTRLASRGYRRALRRFGYLLSYLLDEAPPAAPAPGEPARVSAAAGDFRAAVVELRHALAALEAVARLYRDSELEHADVLVCVAAEGETGRLAEILGRLEAAVPGPAEQLALPFVASVA